MPLTDADKRRISNEAAYHVRKKIKLEKYLRRNINKFFVNQNGIIKIRLSNGNVYNASEAIPELEKILEEHYDRTSLVFIPFVLNFLNKNLNRITGDGKINIDNNILNATLRTKIKREISNTAQIITNTTNRIIGKAIKDLDSKEVTEFSKRSEYVFEKLEAKRRMRSDVTAITETNKAAESSKNATAKEYFDNLISNVRKAGIDGTIATLLTSGKSWVTMMDNNVRSWHANALFQERRFDEPFEVMREFLMFPGDTDLGASPRNVNRCRCASIPFLI